jgi:hypothetical protein
LLNLNRRLNPSRSSAFLVVLGLLAGSARSQNPTTPSKLSAAVIVLGRNGFSPATITHHAGNILLVIHNETGQNHVTMHLKNSAGGIVHDVPVISTRQDWHELVNLPAGQYTLIEDGHSNWTCQITIK